MVNNLAAVAVHGIHAVVHRSHVDNIRAVRRNDQRLGIHLPIEHRRAEFAKLLRRHIRLIQDSLRGIQAIAPIVVVPGKNTGLPVEQRSTTGGKYKKDKFEAANCLHRYSSITALDRVQKLLLSDRSWIVTASQVLSTTG
jgi:hypothetical protein